MHHVTQIELQEQRSSGRGSKSKDSKRKRKTQKADGEPKSTEASECKKTRPVKHTTPEINTEVTRPVLTLAVRKI